MFAGTAIVIMFLCCFNAVLRYAGARTKQRGNAVALIAAANILESGGRIVARSFHLKRFLFD
jgi:hypothetical protein